MSREMKKGVVDLAVLAVVAGGDVSAAEVVLLLDPLFPAGTIYPSLARLERAGHLDWTRRRPDTGRPRKEYRLSPSGKEELAELSREWDDLVRAVEAIRKEAN